MVEIIKQTTQQDTTTLAAHAAVSVESTLASLKEPILLIDAWFSIVIEWPNLLAKTLLVFGYGTPSVAEIDDSLNNPTTNFEMVDDYRQGQNSVRRSIDFVALEPPETVARMTVVNWSPRLPKKGLPSQKGGGFELYVYNLDVTDAFVDGPTLHTQSMYRFAFLGR